MSDIHHYVDNDHDYLKIVDHILQNEEFNKLRNIEHHGLTRYDHCLKVSYYAYKVAKTLKLDYREVARGGLLHDFFLSDDERTGKEKFISIFVHPKKAEKKACEHFELSERECDIIRSHMFPINFTVPKYIESWVVNIVDKCVGTYEFAKKFKKQLTYSMNIWLLIFVSFFK